MPTTACRMQVNNFTAAFSWDFGIITVGGLASSLHVADTAIVNTKNVAIMPLLSGGMQQRSDFRFDGGALVGQTHDDVCSVRSRAAAQGPCRPATIWALMCPSVAVSR